MAKINCNVNFDKLYENTAWAGSNCATTVQCSSVSDVMFTIDEINSKVNAMKEKKPDVDPEVKSSLEVCGNQVRAIFYKDGFKESTKNLIPDIKNIIVHNDCAVIVEFVDGTTEKAVLHPDDNFSLEQGISICITKKLVGGSAIYNKLMERALKVKKDNDVAREKKIAEDKERKERYKKYVAKKIARKERRREDYINTQKEAYLKAWAEINATHDDVEK